MMKRRSRFRRAPLSACLLALLLPATALAGPPLAAFSAEVDAPPEARLDELARLDGLRRGAP